MVNSSFNPKIQLLKSLLISDFPSGSSINYYEGKFYLIGDDSTNILILDANYQKVDSVLLFDYSVKRIPKSDKTDLEGSVILDIAGVNHLLIVGSASRKNRKRIILIPFSKKGIDFTTLSNSIHKTKVFINRIHLNGIEEINLEGVCLINDNLLLGNRGNRSRQNNYLIITDRNFWERQEDSKIQIRRLLMPANDQNKLLGLSELCYIKELDMLLITLTSEDTADAYLDGSIGDSYIGWIRNATTMIQLEELMFDGLICLSDVDPSFTKEKIEGICLESVKGSEILVHLIADNDAGESRLFKISVIFN